MSQRPPSKPARLITRGIDSRKEWYRAVLACTNPIRLTQISGGKRPMSQLPISRPLIMDEQDASGQTAEIFDEIRLEMELPFVPNIIRATSTSTGALSTTWHALHNIFMKGTLPSSLSSMILYSIAAGGEGPSGISRSGSLPGTCWRFYTRSDSQMARRDPALMAPVRISNPGASAAPWASAVSRWASSSARAASMVALRSASSSPSRAA